MKFAVTAALTLTAGLAQAAPLALDSATLPSGALNVDNGRLMLDQTELYRDDSLALYDLGPAGILVAADHGGKQCPQSYHLVDRETGKLRDLRPESDRTTLFAECERLVETVPELGVAVFTGRTSGEVASVWTWNGETMVQNVVARAATPAPVTAPVSAATGLEKWEGAYVHQMLRDAEGRAHLATALRPEELTHADLVAHAGSAMSREGDFIIGGACHSTDCEWRWVMIALRVTDGAVFALLAEDGIDVVKPDGEDLPDALMLALEMGELP